MQPTSRYDDDESTDYESQVKGAVKMKFALWFSVIVTFLASLFLGLIGVGVWLVCWALFLLIFRPWKRFKKVEKSYANVIQTEKANERFAKQQKLDDEFARMNAERVARREARRNAE